LTATDIYIKSGPSSHSAPTIDPDERNWDLQALEIMDFPTPLTNSWEIGRAWGHGNLCGPELCEEYGSEDIRMASWDSTTLTPAVVYRRWENLT
jgi:hypothetical protein